MSDTEPIHYLRPHNPGAARSVAENAERNDRRGLQSQIRFDRQELSQILSVYGRKVASGEWRDYAIDMGREKAVFSVFRKSSEWPLLRIEKNPKLARKQGAYSVISATGLILKRGHDLRRVLDVIDRRVELVR